MANENPAGHGCVISFTHKTGRQRACKNNRPGRGLNPPSRSPSYIRTMSAFMPRPPFPPSQSSISQPQPPRRLNQLSHSHSRPAVSISYLTATAAPLSQSAISQPQSAGLYRQSHTAPYRTGFLPLPPPWHKDCGNWLCRLPLRWLLPG